MAVELSIGAMLVIAIIGAALGVVVKRMTRHRKNHSRRELIELVRGTRAFSAKGYHLLARENL